MLIGISTFSPDRNFDPPKYDQIKKHIKKKSSNLFYDSLMNRYLRADSTMTLEEKRHLYYGYSFNKKYSPYSRSDYDDSLRVIMQRENHSQVEFNKIIQFGDSALSSNPFDLRALNYQLYALDQIGNKEIFDKKVTQLRTIFDALISSGNGASKKEAFYVIYTTHEYDLLDVLGFTFGGHQSLIEHYDYLTVAENDAGIEGLYFDVSPCLNSMSKMFKE